MSDIGGFQPVLAFDTDDSEFVRGFEAGRLWECLKSDLDAVDGQPIHSVNAEMVIRMADALNLPVTAEFTADPTWMVLRVSSSAPE